MKGPLRVKRDLNQPGGADTFNPCSLYEEARNLEEGHSLIDNRFVQ